MKPLIEMLSEAMATGYPTLSFHAAVKQRLADGVDRDAMIAELNALIGVVSDEQEEVVQDLLDAFYGRCHQGMRL